MKIYPHKTEKTRISYTIKYCAKTYGQVLITQGRTITEIIEIARDVARKIIESPITRKRTVIPKSNSPGNLDIAG
ncbi:MAG: hypothetical protein E3K32_07105 [wastewater metagenome]|nr:hypothetical protein [Candidatus Loosdrechtia aerotolerans]